MMNQVTRNPKKNLFYALLRSVLVIILILNFSGCTEPYEGILDDPIQFDKVALRGFDEFLRNNQSILVERTGDLKNDLNQLNSANLESTIHQLTEEEAQEMLQPLLNQCLQLLRSSGFNDSEIESEFGSLDSPEIIATAFIVLELGAIEYDQPRGIKNPKSENGLLKCLATATGLQQLWSLPWNLASQSRRVILKAVGKFALKNLGWIGWAFAAGEFIQCYWGNSSAFDSIEDRT